MSDQKSNFSEEFEDNKKGPGLNPGVIVVAFLTLAALILVSTIFLKDGKKSKDAPDPQPLEKQVKKQSTSHSPTAPAAKPGSTPKQPSPLSSPKRKASSKSYSTPVQKKSVYKSKPKKAVSKPAVKTIKNKKKTTTKTPEQVALSVPPAKPEEEITVYEAEDLPIPSKPKVTAEIKQPIALSEPKTPKETNHSAGFQDAMNAYNAKKYSQAAKAFSKVPKPTTKKRGDKQREEYVKAHFYRGLALQKVGNLHAAVKAYETVLTFERFFPICEMNLGICYMGLKQYAKADRAFKHVIRDQNRIPPDQYDNIMQRTRYFWALTWTKLFKESNHHDKKLYFQKQASLKWSDYKAWFGNNKKYAAANVKADNYIKSISYR